MFPLDRCRKPDSVMGINREASATNLASFGLRKRENNQKQKMGFQNYTHERRYKDGFLESPLPGHENALHVEHVDALVMSHDLVSFKTGGLILIRGDLSCFGSGANGDNRCVVVVVRADARGGCEGSESGCK
jgi:hypothetical protein